MDDISVLVVDDEPATLAELCEFLAEEEYKVLAAANGVEALEVFEEEKVDIVLTDVRMPEMDGIELLRRIKKLNQGTSVVVVTGHGTEETAIQALRAGASNYLKKPIDIGELERTIIGLIAISRAREIDPVSNRLLIEETRTLEIPSDPTIVPAIVNNLCKSLPLLFDLTNIERIEIALGEMIENAIEHGNLEISYQEKAEAREQGRLMDLINARNENPKYKGRIVTVSYRISNEGVEYTITDEGMGFDWRSVMDSIDADGLMRHSGRGIILSSHFLDELKYNDKGNSVRLFKSVISDEYD